MDLEAILLTGGASGRMGRDKAALEVSGEPLALRIAREIDEAGIPLTVCGREPLPGARFLKDQEDFAGPLSALARVESRAELVFVVSCDLPKFRNSVISGLRAVLGEHQAAIPVDMRKPQPLCALYRADAIAIARGISSLGEKRMMVFLDAIDWIAVPAESLEDPLAVRNVNTPEELEELIADE